jgi:preprotein translocase SecE subunit
VAFEIYKQGQGKYVRVPTVIGAVIVLCVLCVYFGIILDRRLATEPKPLAVEWGLKDAAREVLGGPQISGLKAQYYDGKWQSLPDFGTLTPAKQIETKKFDVTDLGHANYGLVYQGKLEVTKPGEYSFFVKSHDGSRLLIDKAAVVENDGLHQVKEESGKVELTAGSHDFRLEYFRTLSTWDMFFAARVYFVYGLPALAFIGLGIWVGLLLNKPAFVDFLIATESEMKKVSWSSRAELIGSTIVVIVTVVLLAIVIWTFDTVFIFGARTLGLW